LLLGCALPHPLEATVTYKTAAEILNAVDQNYTRTTTTYFTADAYNEVKAKNHYDCFTQSRVTLWTPHALYMHNNSSTVNSGYLDQGNALYHYTLKNGVEDVTKTDKSLVENVALAVPTPAGSSSYTIHDFFTGAATFNLLSDMLAPLFSPVSGRDGVYSSSDSNLLKQFMYFCAPLYTNPEVVTGTPYLTFTKVEIVDLNDGTYKYNLYAEETAKLSTSDGLFATAVISAVGATSIPVIAAYLA
jgi:hypothetical protein